MAALVTTTVAGSLTVNTGSGGLFLAAGGTRIYSDSVTLTGGVYTSAFEVTNASGLASSFSFTIKGTVNAVVLSTKVDVVLNHSKDITVTSQSGNYTPIEVKILTSNNEDCLVQIKASTSGSVNVPAYIDVVASSNAVVSWSSFGTYTGTSLEHACKFGFSYSTCNGGDTSKFVMDGTYEGGRMGIGTDEPTSKLCVGGVSTQTTNLPTIVAVDTANGASLQLRGGAPRIFMDSMAGGVPKILMDSRGIEFKDGTLDSEGNVDVKIAADGNVGIGITNPSARLHVNGTVTVDGALTGTTATFSGAVELSGGARLMLGTPLLGQTSGGTSTQLIFWGGTYAYYGRTTTSPNNGTVTGHVFRAAGNTRLTVDNSNITLTAPLVGTSATFSDTITTTDGSSTFTISGDSSSNTYLAATGEIRIRPSGTTINKFVIGSNGNLTTAGTISSGAITTTGALTGTSATFSGNITIASGTNRSLITNYTSAPTSGNSSWTWLSMKANGTEEWRIIGRGNVSDQNLEFLSTTGGVHAVFDKDGATTFNGALTGTSATFSGDISMGGDMTIGGDSAAIAKKQEINLSSLSQSNFYPVVMSGSPSYEGTVQFTLGMWSQTGSDPYNSNMVVGWARAQGWSDMALGYNLFFNCYTDSERTILGVYRGTQASNRVIFYLRGGEKYYFTTANQATAYTVAGSMYNEGTTSTSLTVAMIKDSTGADIASQADASQNLSRMVDLFSGKQGTYSSKPYYNNNIAFQGTSAHEGAATFSSTLTGTTATFSGALTWSGGGSANANTAYTYSQVGHLPLAGGTLTGALTGTTATFSSHLKAETYRSSRSDGDIYIQATTANDFVAIGTQVSPNLMRILGDGNVGIGYDSPECLLDLKKSLDAPLRINLHNQSTNAAADATISFETNGQMDWGMGIDRTDGHFKIGRANTLGTNTVVQLDGSGTISAPSVFIDASDGKVGIGTTSPGRELDVDGRVLADTYGFRSDSTLKWYYFDNYSGSNFIGRGGNAYTALYDSGTQSMVWKNGKVGIGITNPEAQLHVRGSDGYLKFDTSGADGTIKSDYNLKLYADDNNNNSSTYQNIQFFTAGANERLRIDSAGDAIFYKSAYTQNSNGYKILLGKGTRWGYSSAYKAIQIGDASGNYTVCIGYDPSGNANGSFTGDGGELLFRNNMTFMTPNAADNGWHPCMHFQDGNVKIGSGAAGYKLDVGGTLGVTGALTGTSATFSGIVDVIGTQVSQTTAKISARANGNSFEFGHGNNAGYVSTIGCNNNNGYPFLAFSAEAGTNNNTFKTRGLKGNVILADTSGNLTFNQVTTASADNQALVERMRILHDGKVGIGTNAPGELLEVSASTEAAIQITSTLTGLSGGEILGSIKFKNHDTSGTDPHICGQISSVASSIYGRAALAFYTGRTGELTEKLRIQANGNVGIGNAAPDVRLLIDAANGLPATTGTVPNGFLGFRSKTAGATHALFMGVSNASPWGSWLQAQDGNALGTTYPLLLNPNGGKVGIGITSPAKRLHVFGDSIRNESSTAGIYSQMDGDGFTIYRASSNCYINFPAASSSLVVRGPSYAEFLRINSSGSVGIGTDNPGMLVDAVGGQIGASVSGGSSHKVYLTGDNSNCTLTSSTGLLVNGTGIRLRSSASTLYVNDNNTQNVSLVSGGGKVGIGTASPSAKFDVRGARSSDYFNAVRLANTDTGSGAEQNRVGVEFWDRTTALNTAIIGSRGSVGGHWGGMLKVRVNQVNSPQTAESSLTDMLVFDGYNNKSYFPTGSVGIGTNAPSSELHVNGGLTSGTNDDNRALFGYTSPRFYIGTRQSGTNYLDTVSVTSGKVGIGITNPTARLYVVETANNAWALQVKGTGTSANYGLEVNCSAGYNLSSQPFKVDTPSGGPFFIDGNANVGIGDGTPTYKLDVNGTGRFTGALTGTSATFSGSISASSFSGSGASLTTLNASNISSGTIAASQLGSGSSITTKFLRGDNTWQTVSSGSGTVTSVSVGTGLDVSSATTTPNITLSLDEVSAGLKVHNGSATTPSYNFNSDTNTGMYRIASDVIGFAAGGAHTLAIGNGNVGIGTTNPTKSLHIVGTTTMPLYIYYATENDLAEFAGNNSTYARIRVNNGNTAGDAQMSFMSASSTKWTIGCRGSDDSFHIHDGFGSFPATTTFVIDGSTGNVGIGTTAHGSYKLYTQGSTGASGTKYFDMIHPDPSKGAEGYRLRHGAVEAPAFGENLYRFIVTVSSDGGSVTTDLPSYFSFLNENPQVWIQARGMFAQAYGEINSDLTSFIVTGEKAGQYDVLIIGSRKSETTGESDQVFAAEYK